jgi:hypothetical protein
MSVAKDDKDTKDEEEEADTFFESLGIQVQDFDVYRYKVSKVRTSKREPREYEELKVYNPQSVVDLLAKPRCKQYLQCLEQQTLDEKYPVAALHGQQGVKTTKAIKEGECVAIYEGVFSIPEKKAYNAYTVNIVADYCLPCDMQRLIDFTECGIPPYLLNPTKETSNLSMYVNDAKDHPQEKAKNIELVQFTTNHGLPVIGLIAVRDILPNEDLFTCYGDSYWHHIEKTAAAD